MLSWKIFSHYLMSHRSGALIRSIAWICILGVAVGVMALIVVVGIMNGFNASARDRYLRWEPHLVVHVSQGLTSDKVHQHITQALSLEEVDELELVEVQDLIVKSLDGAFAGVVAKGFSTEGMERFFKRLNLDSQGDSVSQKVLSKDEMLIGIGVAANLRVYEGDLVDVISPEALLLPPEEAPPAIRMLVSERPFQTGLEEIDGVLLLYNRDLSLKRFRDSSAREEVFEIRLGPKVDLDRAAKRLRDRDLKVETWPERNSAMFFALKMEKAAMTTFLALSALITSFSILTVLVLLVTQKRKDIGMLLAMGLTPEQTRRIFTQVGLWLSGLGVGIGVVLGVVICWVIDRYPLSILPDIYQERTIPAEISWSMIALVVLASLVIALAGSWFPAYMSARGTPAEALRSSARDV